MNIVLWTLQILLGVAFTAAGAMKATQSKEQLSGRMTWVNRYSPNMVKFIGVMEILGGLGLILPWATGIAKILTPLAAVGLVVIMVLAAADHIRAKEYKALPVNAVLGVIALVIAIGRF